MTALVKGVALGVTPDPPEDEPFDKGDRVTYSTGVGLWEATVVEVWDDCIEIQVDHYPGTHLVHAHELRPTDPAPRRAQ